MPGNADAWRDELKQEAEHPPPRPPRPKVPVILGGAAALAVSGALAWWLTSPGNAYRNPESAMARPEAAVVRVAVAEPDAAQVRRAYDEFTSIYATGGRPGVERFSASCETSLRGDPRILDFCLAFSLFSESVGVRPAAAQRVELVRASLPEGQAAADRIAAVRRLMREVSGVPEPAVAPPPAAVEKAVAAPVAPAIGLQKASIPRAEARPGPPAPAARPSAARTRGVPATCRSKPTPADRLICADPGLAVQHWKMRQAYDDALKAGADPLAIDAGQAEWRSIRNPAGSRAELSRLYARRIAELEAAAKARPDTPPAS